MSFKPYTTDNAVALCRVLDPVARQLGWCTGLTGSCLHKGTSKKDFDVILYRLSSTKEKPVTHAEPTVVLAALAVLLKTKGCGDLDTADELDPSYGGDGAKNVTVVTYSCGLRIDFFFLS